MEWDGNWALVAFSVGSAIISGCTISKINEFRLRRLEESVHRRLLVNTYNADKKAIDNDLKHLQDAVKENRREIREVSAKIDRLSGQMKGYFLAQGCDIEN